MSTLKNTPNDKGEDAQRKENEGPGGFPQEFDEEGDVGDLKHGGYQRGDQGGYQGGYDEGKFEQNPLSDDKKKTVEGPRAGDARLVESVRQALAERGPFLDATDLAVDVRDGLVILSGEVAEESTRRDIEAAVAGHCEGLAGVENRIRVNKP